MATTAVPTFSRVSDVCGAEVRGLDLSAPIDARLEKAIRSALLAHHLLVFRDQHLDEAQQLAFTRRFGELEDHVIRLRDGQPPPHLHVISNLDANGQPTARPYSHGNYYWHTDKSYHAVPSYATLLHAVELPPAGGDTQFANMHLAYEALPSKRQRELAGLRLVHSWEASRRNTGNRPATEEEMRDRPPVSHPLIRTHPDTGRRSLYLGMHVSHVEGLEAAASAALIAELMDFATADAFIYSHRWAPGDLVMWDNRSLLHRAMANYDMDRHRRVMHRTVLRGTRPV